MSVIASQLIAAVSTTGVTLAKAQLKEVGDASNDTGNRFKAALGGMALFAGVAAIGIAVASVKMAGDFQQSMTRLVTSAGELASNLPMVSAGVLKMSVDTATSTQQLAAGMYFVESAGNHGADALKVLGVAARGAKSENADLDTVAKALTTTMTDYHMPVSASASAMNGLIITVQNGKTTLQELAASMGQVLPIASSLHISFPQVAGAIDTMTNAGMPAEQAAQNLAHVLTALEAPSKVAVKSMSSVGLTAQQVKDTLVNQGLPQALQLIEDHVGKQFPAGSVAGETALKNIMGGLVGLKLSAQLTGDSLNTTESNIAKITQGMKGGGDAVLGWDAVQGNFNFKLDQARMVVESLAIKIGTNLLPFIGQLLTAFSAIAPNILPAFDKIGAAASTVVTDVKPLFTVIATDATTIGIPALKLAAQAFTGIQSAVGPVIASITTNLIPAIKNIAAVIVPLIAGFISWIAQSGAVANTFTVLKIAIPLVVGAISILINIIAGLIHFFTATEIGSDILKAALILLGVALSAIALVGIAVLIIMLPELVVGFLAAAGGAWTLAAGVIAFTWPILAAIAVIALIVYAVTHWGQIMSAVATGVVIAYQWVAGQISNLCGDINSAFSGVGSIVSGVWNGLISDAKNAINGIIDVINGFISAYDGIGIHIPSYGIGPASTPKIDVTVPQIPKIPHLATGGTITGAGVAEVGEQGREQVWLPQGARVIPNNQLQQSQQQAPQSSGPTYLQIDGRTFARLILPYLTGELRNNVGVRI